MNLPDANRLMEVLGWTLLHSLWQGLIVALLFFGVRLIFPSASTSLKYVISTSALLMILICSVGTFIYLLPIAPVVEVTREGLKMEPAMFNPAAWKMDPETTWFALSNWINDHLSLLISGWLIGVVFFGFRLIVVWWYTQQFRKTAEPIVGFWETKVRELASELGIRRTIFLCQAGSIDAPVLIGYFKPVILLPVGMLSGLSVDQIETILLHELAHIRRYDYVVNFMQSLVEVVFFFNPLVWIISAQIRADREQCCDDLVVQFKSPLTYAKALHQLAEVQTLGTSFSLGVAGAKNQLLHRIQRIMKAQEKKVEDRGKVIPAVVVLCLLAAVSWLSIQAYPDRSKRDVKAIAAKSKAILPDTLKKPLEKVKPVIPSSESVAPPEIPTYPAEIVDPEYAPEVVPSIDALPEMDVMIPLAALTPLAEMPEMNFDFSFADTIPDFHMTFQNEREWDQWGKQFTEEFSERFSDFYKKNQPEFDKMMAELHEKLGKMEFRLDERAKVAMDAHVAEKMALMAERLSRVASRQEEAIRTQAESQRRMERDVHRKQALIELNLANAENQAKSVEKNMKAFEKELNEQLVKDGYLRNGEKIDTLNFDDDGNVTINGKKIKDSDRGKYQELHNKYFKKGRHRAIVE